MASSPTDLLTIHISLRRVASPGVRQEPSPAGRTLLHLAFGANHTLALLKFRENDTTELWGYDSDGTVFRPLDLPLERHGLEGYLPRLVAASWETTYVVLSQQDMPDVLVSMGGDDFGDLGIGAKRAGKLPAKDSIHIVGFDHLEFNGVAVDKDSFMVESLAAGQHHVVVRLKTNAGCLTVGWGTSRHGQLGDVEKPFASAPALISADDSIVSSALGHQHTVFRHANGTVSGLGSNKKRQLDGIDAITRARSVACTWNGTYISSTGDGDTWELLSAGNNASGQLGRDTQGHLARVEFPFTPATHRLLQVACGSEHVLASFIVLGSSTTEVWGWGWNEHGNLGVGTTEDVRVPVKIWPSDASQASSGDVAIWAGSGTSWIIVQ
ncbi:Secretion-regulating guanine nucleotide exchange factor [Mycena sanguinolenta]|uniref:Secretion-regulating guanine nucleotide exchange factor n=1 Tax=Mycena sanguinolenta TaxID=230812 RepID=A0A8H7CHF8_9AGAR|nr:Secretion-regulating guanine nucleotide exchange factor [Mycena sanguinolenta]